MGRVAFEILSAWDEMISLGWRENVNLQQVRSVLEMESHEEKIQEIIARVSPFRLRTRVASDASDGTEQGTRGQGRAQATSEAA